MKASIIIPTKDKLTRLRLTLQGLEGQIDNEVEVIIVFDGCHPDMIAEFQRIQFSYIPIYLICKQNVGRAVARNLGIEKATGELVIFLDDDRVPGPDFVQRHIDGHNIPCIVLGERKDSLVTEEEIAQLFDTGTPADKLSFLQSKVVEQGLEKQLPIKPTGKLNWLTFFTGNVSVPRQALQDAGLFDENFKGWGHEDLDLGIRLSREGLVFKKDTSIVSYHLLHDSNFNVAERTRQSLVNLRYMLNKYKYSLPFWVLLIFYIKQKLLGLSIHSQVVRSKPANEHVKG